jgi:predicted ATPase
MNIGERIALLQEELRFEDEKKEVLYSELHQLFDPWPESLEKNLTFEKKQELPNLNKERQRGESEALARRPEFSTWNSAEETQSNLRAVLKDLRKTNGIVERIIEIIKKAKRQWGQTQGL